MFGNLKSDGLEKSNDTLGGDFSPVESNVYDLKVKAFYAGKSAGGAQSLTLLANFEDGKEFSETIYVTNKNGQNYYEKENKKYPLPGFSQANHIAMVLTERELADAEFKEIVLELWNPDEKKRLPTRVQAMADVKDKILKVAILRKVENKNEKDAEGTYVPVDEERVSNAIDKVFLEDGRTVNEALASGEAVFIEQWLAKNKGKDRNTYKVTGRAPAKNGEGGAASSGGASSSSGSSAAAKPKLVFGRKS